MNIDIDFLRSTVEARRDVNKWLNERPYTGLDVTDVELLLRGYDYLAMIIKDLTGQNPVDNIALQLNKPTITWCDGV